ncbi:uncharacterized protein BDW43DRAFT_282962 [Aspergillus alliaceus]|uniref:uncharacterized protein n=1 Tax=Petromyces alliaceus TaxID=209559 RepID=UPI0012A444EC|nr:uncharacterized protein BDW43DRAFT_282962 [Aspergillus alliaceus]KAB8231172.1 hypothetical protein BDW43DRAFT_282962 [Aspergillus alliaceus]
MFLDRKIPDSISSYIVPLISLTTPAGVLMAAQNIPRLVPYAFFTHNAEKPLKSAWLAYRQ